MMIVYEKYFHRFRWICIPSQKLVRDSKKIVQSLYPKELGINIYGNDYVFESNDCISEKSDRDAELFFKKTGSFLSAITVIGLEQPADNIIHMVSTYCILERLNIFRLKIPRMRTPDLKATLKQLHLGNVKIECDEHSFAGFNSLIELKVCDVDNCGAILANEFPKLRTFSYKCRCDNEFHLLTFFLRNTKLKTLDVFFHTEHADSILEVIGNKCKKVEEFEMNVTSRNMNSLTRLRSLKKLRQLTIKFDGSYEADCIIQLEALKSLEVLKVSRVRDGLHFIPALSLLKGLRELYLDNCIEPEHSYQFAFLGQLTKLHLMPRTRYYQKSKKFKLAEVIELLVNLEELAIGEYFVLDAETFYEIVDIVAGRKKVLRLICKFDFFDSMEWYEARNVILLRSNGLDLV